MRRSEHHNRLDASRRTFLRQALLGAGAALAPGWAASGTPPANHCFVDRPSALSSGDVRPERLLVLLELSGGNDGLDTIIPFRDDAYHRARPSLRHRGRPALPAGGDRAFHPSLVGLARLWSEGRLAIVEGCGPARPSRSHFAAMEHWHTGASGGGETRGWIGRLADASWGAGADPALVHLGARPSPALRAWTHRPLALGAAERARRDSATGGARERALHAIARYRTPVAYGETPLASDLRKIAALVAAGFSTRVYSAGMGGFDTHAAQASARARHLGALDEALYGFDRDLRRLGRDREVVTLVFSEFGRRLEENACLGTDHGTAGPVLVAGASVVSGFHGAPPRLEAPDASGDVAVTTDFRRVYASIAMEWFGIGDTHALLHREIAPLGLLA